MRIESVLLIPCPADFFSHQESFGMISRMEVESSAACKQIEKNHSIYMILLPFYQSFFSQSTPILPIINHSTPILLIILITFHCRMNRKGIKPFYGQCLITSASLPNYLLVLTTTQLESSQDYVEQSDMLLHFATLETPVQWEQNHQQNGISYNNQNLASFYSHSTDDSNGDSTPILLTTLLVIVLPFYSLVKWEQNQQQSGRRNTNTVGVV